MLRKLCLAAIGGLTLLAVAGLGSTTAYAADPGCNGNNLPLGIYNDALQVGKFDLAFNPTTAGAFSEATGGAILCGTNKDTGLFYQHGRIFYPNKSERVNCGVPNPVVHPRACDLNNDGDIDVDENLPDTSYAGSSVADVYCNGGLFTCGVINQNDNVVSHTFIDYDTSGKGGPNRCVNTATTGVIQCAEARATISTVACDSDVITEINRTTGQYTLTIYKPNCEAPVSGNAYFDTIDDLLICKNASEPGGFGCGTNPDRWQFRNGNAGTWTWNLKALMTDSTIVSSSTQVTWTP